MLQTKRFAFANKIDNQRPIEIAVAISAHDRDLRTDRAERIKNSLRANIAKMPDLIRILRQDRRVRRQTIVRVGEDKNPPRAGCMPPHLAVAIGGAEDVGFRWQHHVVEVLREHRCREESDRP